MNNDEKSPQQQLALNLFNEFKSDGKSISEAQVEIGYAKNNFFIDVSELGLISKRALNACHYIAATSEPDEKGVYTVRDDYFRFLINYESNNLTHLKKSLRDAQKAAAEITIQTGDSAKEEWASFPLLGSAALSRGRVMFSIPSDIIKHIKDPKSYTYLSLRISTAFSSNYAANMYEFLLSQLFRGGTEWMEIDDFREKVGAKNIKTLQDFRNLKRYVLTVCKEQINTLSDIKFDYETKATQGTKKITHIKFRVEHNTEGVLNLQNGYKNQLKELYEILTIEFGLNTENLDEIMSDREKYTNDRILEAIDFTRARLKGKSDIKYPGLYFLKALKEDLRLSTIEAELIQKNKAKRVEESRPKKVAANPAKLESKEKIKKFIDSLSEAELDKLQGKFTEESEGNPQLLSLIRSRGLSSKIVEQAFYTYLSNNKLVF